MDWLNENSGILILIFSIILIALIAVTIFIILNLRSKISVQKLNFLGFYTVDKDSKKNFARITVGNKSINDVTLNEIGIQNGKVNFPLTAAYKQQKNLQDDTRIVLEQRSSIEFDLNVEELRKLVIEKDGKKIVGTLKVYAVDSTGGLYKGKIPTVKKLLGEMLAEENNNNSQQ